MPSKKAYMLKNLMRLLVFAKNISTCDLYLYIKPTQYLSLRKLYLLLVSNARWETISINFVVELPELTRFNTMMTIVDSVFKRTHFILTYTTITTESTTRLFLYYI